MDTWGEPFFFSGNLHIHHPSINHPSTIHQPLGAKSFVLRTPGLCASSVGPGRSAGTRLQGGLRGEASLFRSTPPGDARKAIDS